MAEQEVPSIVSQRLIINFLTKEGVIPSEIFTRLQAQVGEKCLSQPRVFSFEKDETMLKMNLTLGDQELLSIQTTF
jgi:intergrase/recombinase